MKTCSKCGEARALSEYSSRGNGKLHAWCKACVKVYDAARWQTRDKQTHKAQRRLHNHEVKEWMDALKASVPCVDCGGYFHPEAMDWDHLPGFEKRAAVSDLVRNGRRAAAEREIVKCELVCRNCHAVRTFVRRERGEV